jgi:hypothetical protein
MANRFPDWRKGFEVSRFFFHKRQILPCGTAGHPLRTNQPSTELPTLSSPDLGSFDSVRWVIDVGLRNKSPKQDSPECRAMRRDAPADGVWYLRQKKALELSQSKISYTTWTGIACCVNGPCTMCTALGLA